MMNEIQILDVKSGEALASFGISKGLWPSCDSISKQQSYRYFSTIRYQLPFTNY